jgi:hypothetical protein
MDVDFHVPWRRGFLSPGEIRLFPRRKEKDYENIKFKAKYTV